MVVETKGGRTATKVKTIVTSNEIKKVTPPAHEVDSSATRRSNRAKQPTNKIIESLPSPTRSLTNGTLRSAKSTPQSSTSTSNVKFQNNLLDELSKKSSNYSPDVVSDLEEILGSPIKTRGTRSEQASRTQPKSEANNSKSSGMVRVDYRNQTDDDVKPATRSSKRLSNRVQPAPSVEPSAKPSKSTARSSMKRSGISTFNQGQSSEESQGSYDNLQMENNTTDNIVLNIKQEKEVEFTMTDDMNVFTCEMCSAVFSDRAQLLVHVPVHI